MKIIKKTIDYFVVLVIGLSIGLAAGLFINREPQKMPHNLSLYELKEAHPETMEEEIVNNEVIDLLTDMNNKSDTIHMQMRIENTVYPYKDVDNETLERLVSLFNEYEWRPNRALSNFEASDFELFIELYTPDMAQVLTLYGGYDLAFYRDEGNETVAYYTYRLPEDDVFADLAVRLTGFAVK